MSHNSHGARSPLPWRGNFALTSRPEQERARQIGTHRVVRAYLAIGLVAIAGFFLLPVDRQLVWYDFFGLFSIAGILAGVRVHRPPARLPWFALSLALFLLVAGDVTLNRYVDLFHHDPPFPNIADAFFMGGNLLVVASLALMLQSRLPGQDRGSLIDAMIIATAVGVLSWLFLMVPYARDPELTNLQRIVSVAYPCIDILMLAMLARLMLGGGVRTPAFWLIAGALTAGMVADTVFGALTLREGVPPSRGHWVDAGWLLWYVLWGASALHPTMRRVTLTIPAAPPELTRRRLAMLTAFALIVPAAGLLETGRHSRASEVIIAIASGVLFLLVLWRIRGLIRTVESARDKFEVAVEREQALRQVSASLVAATDRERILAAATSAVRALGGPGARMRIALDDHGGFVIVSTGDQLDRALMENLRFPPEAIEALAPGVVTVASGVTAVRLRESLHIAGDGVIRLAPLVIEDQIRGAMIVAGGRGETESEQGWLESLASQLALALERTALAEELHMRKSEERFRSLVRNASDIIVITDAGSRIKYVSPSVERVLGFSPDEMTGRVSLEFTHPEDLSAVQDAYRAALQSPGVTSALECRLRHRDCNWHHVEAIMTNLLHDESVLGLVLNIRDVSERKMVEERLTYQAFHDPLTDLPNRALFMDRLQHRLARASRRDDGTAVIFVDLDHFKVINDSLGHEAGDRLLQMVARRVKLNIRSGDTAARPGGDEFALLLEDLVESSEAIKVAERLGDAIRQPFAIEGREVFASASIGIAFGRPGQVDALDLLREADIAMYQAKLRGRGGYAVFDADMGASALSRLELETDPRHAIERDEFELYYQPAVSLSNGEVATMEALVRWRHPVRGIVLPGEFISIAEETGLIVPIGLWVLREACRQSAAWQVQFGERAPSISVNLSARQLLHESIVSDVDDTLRAHGIPPWKITLEITETFAVEDAEANRSTLERLKALGVRLAIDDFGKGYSSLSYLRRLPVDVLKIDRGFVKALGRDPDDTLIISAVSDLAHNLGMVVVAEGIEDASLLDRVRALGCDWGQGYFFARPLPEPLATAYLEMDHQRDGRIAESVVIDLAARASS